MGSTPRLLKWWFLNFRISDSLHSVEVTTDNPITLPQVALGLIPTKDVTPQQPVSAEQLALTFQKKLEDLEQQVNYIFSSQ